MKILIAGIDGYIGTVMSQVLQNKGHEVNGIDTGFYREGWFYNGVKKLPQIINKDTRNLTEDDVKGYDAVIHLADLSNDPLGQNDPELTMDINFHASVNLAKLAKKAGVKRFIYSSSCSAYGIATEDLVNEESQTNPQTAYAKCKVLVEEELKKLADENFSPVMMRNATVYGPSPRMRFDLVVNNLSGKAWVEKQIKMTSDGTPWRPFVHVMDVAEAFAAVLEAPVEVVHNQIFNVGNNKGNYRIREVAEIIGSLIPGCTVTFGNSDGDTRSYKVSFDKIAKVLTNFQSKRTVEDGVGDLLEVYKSIDMSKEIFEFRAFTRLKEIDYLKKTGQITGKLFWK